MSKAPKVDSPRLSGPVASGKSTFGPTRGVPILSCLVLTTITFLLYWPATRFGFVSYDDQDYVTDNFYVLGGLTWRLVVWAFTGSHAANWHPLTWLSHGLDAQLFDPTASGPHLINILFHAANACLLFAVLWRGTRAFFPSAFVAALFAVHPLHVESVAWVSERK